jgi:uncharacterized protein YeeX (DUF496 family)
MSTQEIRKELHKVVDNMPEDVLQNVLDYFKTIEHSSKDRVKLSYNLKKILSEDKLLLQKLAL